MARKSYLRNSTEEKNEQVQQLLDQLNEGVRNFQYNPENFKAILQMSALMPTYSFNNIMLIRAQFKNSSYVASFKKWQSLNRTVIKGQKSIRILAPRFKKEKDKVTGVEESKLIGYLGVPVFDVSQTDGEPLPIDKVKLRLEGESDEAVRIFQWMKLLAAEDDCPVHIAFANGANGYYKPASHLIVLDPSLSVNHLAKTAVHELVHSRVHRRSHHETTKEEMECVAEGVAFIICSYFGLDTSDYSFEYVRGWSSSEGESLMKYGEIIQKAANSLIADFDRVAVAIPAEIEAGPTDEKNVIRGTAIVTARSYRIPTSERKGHLHYYEVRHADGDGFQPAAIQRSVWANHMATRLTILLI
ncbi:ArdC-like ssDNA-binding domain-containing protein [Sporosarcina sp. FSL K6-1508]|uniref:ArdC-like ssDNA-binding domain-containing protein n=1 Tax=Sporosarcina sp. FSL K6-1508 TaxID=2921553 RepID=UPI0030F7C6D1